MTGMEYVYTVYEEKSFSAAAKKLFMTQPALSASVKKVESELGLPIFDRSHSPLRLTDAGRAYIEAAEKIFQIQKNLQRFVNDLAELESGNLVIGGTNFVTACFLPRLIKQFNERYPNIHISVIESSSAELFAGLKQGMIDLVIDSGECNTKEFESLTFFTDRIMLAVPKAFAPQNEPAFSRQEIIAGKHSQRNADRANLQEFQDVPFLLLGKGNDMYRRTMEIFREANVRPHVRLYLNQLMTAYHMATAGLGATFLTDTLIRMAAPNDTLDYYLLDHPLLEREIFIARPRSSYHPRALQAFWNSVRS
ncbi:DNA-binding transcriptional regulator, LysR family [Selenomonas ruminantium]|uniref:DNA-binding transcriptional regulator, LysR family n=1 Tax=Selenomonas ruminantium TaxID=971 RepID=A0A1M6S185_SELRU|nr:LysR family transcriptional regulator [Selenomonas ruminantium]SHK38337.1 DNA-binding transcriptional regulator, LysR family [Selenomonas ruminantium]